MTPKLLALAKVCSVLGNIRDVSWHLSKRGSELEKRWHFPFWTKMVRTKIKPGLYVLRLARKRERRKKIAYHKLRPLLIRHFPIYIKTTRRLSATEIHYKQSNKLWYCLRPMPYERLCSAVFLIPRKHIKSEVYMEPLADDTRPSDMKYLTARAAKL